MARGKYKRHHSSRRRYSKPKRRYYKRTSLLNHPIAIGIILIILSFITFRISLTGWIWQAGEAIIWVTLLAWVLLIAGILTLIAWWRNNVLQHRVGVKFGKW